MSNQQFNSEPDRVKLWQWLIPVLLFPLGLMPSVFMEPEEYSVLLDRFQFITTYPFILAIAFNALRRRDANLFQGSLTFRGSSEGVNRWKLLVGTLLWDTPLMVCLALLIAANDTPRGQAVLILQTLLCLYLEASAGLLFPTLDGATILVNFAPFIPTLNVAAPVVDALAEVIQLTFSGDWLWACVPPTLFGLAGFRLWLGVSERGRRWVVPGVSGFMLAIALSILQTWFLEVLPMVSYEQSILLKTMMTVTTCIMILNYRYLTNQVVIVIGADRRRIHVWVLASVYASFAALVLSALKLFQTGFWDGAGFAQDLVMLLLACLVCVILSHGLTKIRDENWNRFYSQTEAIVDDGVSAVISKILILSLQRFLR